MKIFEEYQIDLTGKEVAVTIKPLGYHADLKNPDDIELRIFGLDDGNPRDYPYRKNGTTVDFTYDGVIKFKYVFPYEQEYFIRIFEKDTRTIKFKTKLMTAKYVAKYAIDKMLAGKLLIIPGFKMKCARFFGKFVPNKLMLKITYNIQKKKIN